MEKKYGLFTAIALVIGIVIGSGVFFKAPIILNASGSLGIGVLAWIIGGAIMICCAVTFAIMGTKYERVNGIVDYSEATLGSKYGYCMGWFMATLYYPSLTGVLGYMSAVYFCMITGWIDNPMAIWVVGLVFLTASFVMNAVSPKLAGRFQVSTCVIKLIPLIAMAIGGIVYGMANGHLVENFTMTIPASASGNPLFHSVVATAFAYEGWIIATSINAELKNAKRNLPLALTVGGAVIMVIYLFYFIGIAGGVEITALTDKRGVELAYANIFGSAMGTILTFFITISCLGTLNGLTMGCARGIYSLAARGEGPAPKRFSKVSERFQMPLASCAFGYVMALIVLLYFMPIDYLHLYGQGGGFFFDISELPIITLYALYIPIFLTIIRRQTDLGPVKRFVWPILAICGCIFMVVAAVDKFLQAGLFQYLLIFLVVMGIGISFMAPSSKQDRNP